MAVDPRIFPEERCPVCGTAEVHRIRPGLLSGDGDTSVLYHCKQGHPFIRSLLPGNADSHVPGTQLRAMAEELIEQSRALSDQGARLMEATQRNRERAQKLIKKHTNHKRYKKTFG